MQRLLPLLLLASATFAQSHSAQLPADDAVRIREFYRLASQIQDQIWPNWSQTPAPLLLVTEDTEFLTHHPAPPREFQQAGQGIYARPRQFPTALQATFPAFGPPSVIAIGTPRNTASKTSTPWLITVMHEHFHQLQYAQPGYDQAVGALGLSRGEAGGGWMLNFPFPYDKPEVAQAYARLRDLLISAVEEKDAARFSKLAAQYVQERKRFFALLSADDGKYFSFRLWQEGIARYTQIKAAEAAARYQPTPEFAALPDFEPFSAYAARARADTLKELRESDLAREKRLVFYPFGAAEGLLLDRLKPRWKDEYFQHLGSMEAYFQE